MQMRTVRYLTVALYEDWKTLKWEKVMEHVMKEKDPSAGLLEGCFRKLAFCRFRPPKEAMHKDLNHLTHLCTSRNAMSVWTPHKMVLVFSSCSLLGYLSPVLFEAMYREMREREAVTEMDVVELVTMIKSMGLLGRTGVKMKCIQPCGIFFGISEMLLDVVKRLAEEERLLALTEKQVCEVWKGLARLRFYDVAYLKPLARETIKPQRLQHYSEDSISDVLFSAAVLKYKERHFINCVLDACVLQHRLKSYSEAELTLLYHGLALLKIKNEAVLTQLDEEVCKSHRFEALTAPQLTTILTASTFLKWFNTSFLNKIPDEVTATKRAHEFSSHGLDHVVRTFAKVGVERELSILKKAMLESTERFQEKILYQDL